MQEMTDHDAAAMSLNEYGEADRYREAADEIERLRAAAKPFAEHDWYDAELEEDTCQLVKHSGMITVGHWRALRAALGMEP